MRREHGACTLGLEGLLLVGFMALCAPGLLKVPERDSDGVCST